MPDLPHDQPSAPRKRSRGRAVGLIIAGILVLLVAAGAVLFLQVGWPLDSPRGTGVTRDENFQEPAEPAQFHPDGSAEDNLPFFAQTLREFAAGGEAVEGVPVVNAVSAAGFDRTAMQVSFDRTQTNLVADNIFVSVLIGTDCLVGQVVTADRTTFAVVEPAVGPSQDICLIGNTRPIDWD